MAKAVVEVLLAIISLVALIGNTLVVILLVKKREWLKKVHSCLLLALAVQDILTSIGLFVLPGFVQASDAYEIPGDGRWLRNLHCSIIWSRYIPFALAIASVYTCLMLAVDRWMAVFRPISYRRFSTSNRVKATMVIFPWVAGFAFEINTALNVGCVKRNDGSYVCSWNEMDYSPKSTAIAIVSFFGMIVFPAILIIITYTQIVMKRRNQTARILPTVSELGRNLAVPNQPQHSTSNSSLRRLTRMACAASAIVFVCWLPDQFYFCLFQLGLVDLRTPLHDGLIILAFLNICVNPLLYSFSNKQYAQEFKIILLCRVY